MCTSEWSARSLSPSVCSGRDCETLHCVGHLGRLRFILGFGFAVRGAQSCDRELDTGVLASVQLEVHPLLGFGRMVGVSGKWVHPSSGSEVHPQLCTILRGNWPTSISLNAGSR